MVPEKIGRYEIKSELGRGGMATVFLAHDPIFGRDVAIKVLPRQFLHDPTFRGRFHREARTVARLEHPAIAPVYDFGEEKEQPFLVMRYMSGGSLLDKMRAGPIPLDDIVSIIQRLGEALDYAHSEGIIHRDLKPGNILFDQHNHAFLSDFGIVKLAESTSTYTGSAIIGTPTYMSPEQIQGEKDIDGRTDIYSLGVIAFEMLTGRLPYKADTPAKIMMAHVLEPVPQVSEIRADLPPSCQQVIDKALAKDRAQRFSTATEMAQVLEAATVQRKPLPSDVYEATMIEPPLPETAVKPPAAATVRPRYAPTQPEVDSAVEPEYLSPAVQPQKRGVPWWLVGVGCLLLGGVGVVGLAFMGLIFSNLDGETATATRPPTQLLTPTGDLAATLAAEANSGTATVEAAAAAAQQTEQAVAGATATARFSAAATASAQETATVVAAQTATIDTAQAAVDLAATWPLVSGDNFNIDDESWCIGDLDAELLTGSRFLSDGKYRWEIEAYDDFVWWCTTNLIDIEGDFYYTLEGQLVSGPDDAAFGVMFQRTDEDYYYLFRIENDGWFQLLIRYIDDWEEIIPWTSTELVRTRQANKFTVIRQGNRYILFLNDVFVGAFEDSRLTGGQVGISTTLFNNGDIGVFEFDNMQFRAP